MSLTSQRSPDAVILANMAGTRTPRNAQSPYLDGQLLIAMPAMTDRRFARSVIYLCAHSAEGAFGLIINQPAPHISFVELLEQLNILPGGTSQLEASGLSETNVQAGGPVEPGRGFVLHSSDYVTADSTLRIGEKFCLTATVDILKAMANRNGPKRSILALGYAGWSAGQLEREIQDNGWLNCPADFDLVFDTDIDEKYEGAMSRLGINPTHLVNDAGHA
jgi:putative transcriptional regulator